MRNGMCKCHYLHINYLLLYLQLRMRRNVTVFPSFIIRFLLGKAFTSNEILIQWVQDSLRDRNLPNFWEGAEKSVFNLLILEISLFLEEPREVARRGRDRAKTIGEMRARNSGAPPAPPTPDEGPSNATTTRKNLTRSQLINPIDSVREIRLLVSNWYWKAKGLWKTQQQASNSRIEYSLDSDLNPHLLSRLRN